MFSNDYEQLCSNLENQELEAPNGIASPQVYGQLLAIYLLQNELCHAKFLWKRIPPNVISSNPELTAIWAIGQKMWKKDLPATYQAIAGYAWTEPYAILIKALEDKIRERTFNLIGRSYSTISSENVCAMTGTAPDLLKTACESRGWSLTDNGATVLPVPPPKNPTLQTSSEDQLHKLTEFVSFLEN